MSHLERLEEEIREMVTRAEGDPKPVKTVLAAELRASRLLLLGAWEGLAQLGARRRDRVPAEVEWAHGIVKEILLRLGIKDERWRTLGPVAQGLVDMIARQVEAYHQEHQR
jgi:hypothetical protein